MCRSGSDSTLALAGSSAEGSLFRGRFVSGRGPTSRTPVQTRIGTSWHHQTYGKSSSSGNAPTNVKAVRAREKMLRDFICNLVISNFLENEF